MSVSISLKGAYKLKETIKNLMQIFPEEVRAMVLEVAYVDVLTHAINEQSQIPVDTGRLRASYHVKYLKKPNPETPRTKAKLAKLNELGKFPESQMSFVYQAKESSSKNAKQKTYDGSLSENVDLDTVVVGTNVEYAKKINREGGGGENSRPYDEAGNRYSKGRGIGHFDKAIINGQIGLNNEMKNLASRLEREIAKRAADKAKDGEL